MPPEVIRLLEAVVMAAAVVLILPKRSWKSIRPRFRDLRAGRRAALYEPPQRRPASLPGQLLAELPRTFELGVPVFVATRIAERRAQSIRQAEEAAWRATSSAVLLDHPPGTHRRAGGPPPAGSARPATTSAQSPAGRTSAPTGNVLGLVCEP